MSICPLRIYLTVKVSTNNRDNVVSVFSTFEIVSEMAPAPDSARGSCEEPVLFLK